MRLRIIILSCLLFVVSGCSTDDPTRHNTFIPLTSMEVTGTFETMADQTTNQYRAIGDFSGAFTRDITSEVFWEVENITVATVSNDSGSEGLVTALAPGETSITATYDDFSGSAPVVVTAAFLTGIDILPQDAVLQAGITQQYGAIGNFSDTSFQDITFLVTWESSASDVATIDDAGLATTLDPGNDNVYSGGRRVGLTEISADWQGIEAGTSLVVTGATLTAIAITPGDATLAQGTTVQFAAEGTFSDDTTLDISYIVDWQSTNTDVGLVNAEGQATGISPGETEISALFAADGETITATAVLTVSNAVIDSILLTPEDSTIAAGTSQQFSATGVFSDNSEQDITDLVTWLSSDSAVGVISNSVLNQGLFVSVASGTSVIEAMYGGVSGETLLTVE